MKRIVLPGIVDRYRNLRNGKKRYVGHVQLLKDNKFVVIAEAYGETMAEMRERKHAIAAALKLLENHTKNGFQPDTPVCQPKPDTTNHSLPP